MKYVCFSLIAALLGLGSCHDSGAFDNKIYFSGTDMSVLKRFSVERAPISYPISISSALKVEDNVTISLECAPELTEDYNTEHETNYKMLPEGSYELSSKTVTIESGAAASAPVDFIITSLDKFEDGAVYLMPVMITKSSIGTLESCSIIYLIVNRTIITQAANLDGNYFFKVDQFMTDERLKDAKAFTFETRIRPHRFRTEPERPTSCAVMGIEEVCLMRFGDVNIQRNQLQMAGFCPLTAPTLFSTDVWYHIAVTYDGKAMRLYINGRLDASVEKTGTVDLTRVNPDGDRNEGWRIGYAAGNKRCTWADFSETRVWSVARTQAELTNNMCFVDPKSEGLVAYWRFNEGEGGLIKDYSPSQYDIEALRYVGSTGGNPDGKIGWADGVRCEP